MSYTLNYTATKAIVGNSQVLKGNVVIIPIDTDKITMYDTAGNLLLKPVLASDIVDGDGNAIGNQAAVILWTDQNFFVTGTDISFTEALRPANPVTKRLYYNSDAGRFEMWDGAAWNYVNMTATPTLVAPATITPTGGSTQISVAFALSTNATSYKVEASSDNFTTIAATNTGSGTPIIITGLTNGVAYKTRVKALAVGYMTSIYRTTAGTTTPA